MNFFQKIFINLSQRSIEFADFTAHDIATLNLLNNYQFTSFTKWTGKEGEFRTAPKGYTNGKYASLIGTHNGIPISFFIGEQEKTRNIGKDKKEIYYVYSFFMDVEISFFTPHVIITPIRDTSLSRLSALNGTNIDFGKFNDFYSVLATKKHEAKTFELLPPDTLLHLIERIPDVSITYHKNVIRFEFKVLPMNEELTQEKLYTITKKDFVQQFTAILNILPEIIDSAHTARITPEEFVSLKGVVSPISYLIAGGVVLSFGLIALVINGVLPMNVVGPIFAFIAGIFLLSAVITGIKAGGRRRKMRKDGFSRKD